MSFASNYRRKMDGMGATQYERSFANKARQFELFFDNTLTRQTCIINGKKTQAVFQDHSQSNNKDLSDDKYLVVPNNVEVGVGSYVNWRDNDWLVFTEEVKTIPTHQQLKIKHVNMRLKWVTDYKTKAICNNGEGWGAYVQNQTLYTLGVSFSGQHTALANAKMMLYLQNNEETRKLRVGTRLFLGGQVYKVEFVDPISRIGLINLLLDEDTKNPEIDNIDEQIANYWKAEEYHLSNENKPQESLEWHIQGSEKDRLGRVYTYKVVSADANGSEVQHNVQEWIVEDIENLPFIIQERNEKQITLRVKNDFRLVGQTANLMAKVNDSVKNITIKIVNKFG